LNTKKNGRVYIPGRMKKVPDFPISVHVEDNPLKKKDSRFLCNVRFKNDLPEIPSDPKMLLSQLNLDEIGRFELFQNERDMFGGAAPPLRFPLDMGLSMSALYAEQYDVYAEDMLAREDVGLLDAVGEARADGRAHEGRKRKGVGAAPWLMRTKYISSESGGMASGSTRKDKGAGVQVAGSAQDQVRQINKSFRDAASEKPVHPLNKSLTPVDVKPLLPDEALEDWQLVLVNFDSDPVENMNLKDPSLGQERKWAQSLHLKTLKSAEYGRFAVILAPRESSDAKTYGEDETIPGGAFLGDYDWMRTYNETVRVDEKGQTYLFRVEDGSVGFSTLRNKMFLRKRKKSKTDGDADGVDSLRPQKMVLVAEEE
jgi:RNA polymerase II-associated factor 1